MKRSSTRLSGLLPLVVAFSFQLFAQTAAPGRHVIEVPFDFIHGAIVVQAKVNGRGPYSMLLDTGADPSIVELSTAKSIGLKIAEKGEQGSGGGTGANLAYPTSLQVVQLGALRATNVDAVAMDLSKINTAMGRALGGVLGYSLLQGRIVQVDYPHHQVRFLDAPPQCARPAGPQPPACTVLPFRYQDDILATGVTVNGRRVIATIDTGSNGTFQVNPSAIDKLGLQ